MFTTKKLLCHQIFRRKSKFTCDNEHDRVGKRWRKRENEDGTDDYFAEDDIDGVEIIDYWT